MGLGLLDFFSAGPNETLPSARDPHPPAEGVPLTRRPSTMSSEQPLKSVYRSASISLRKADLARQNEDQDEELYQLNQFAKTVRLTLQTHRLWERRKDDKDAVELVAKLPGRMRGYASSGARRTRHPTRPRPRARTPPRRSSRLRRPSCSPGRRPPRRGARQPRAPRRGARCFDGVARTAGRTPARRAPSENPRRLTPRRPRGHRRITITRRDSPRHPGTRQG